MHYIYKNILSCSHLHNILLSSVDSSVISALNHDYGKSAGLNLRKLKVRIGKIVTFVRVDFVKLWCFSFGIRLKYKFQSVTLSVINFGNFVIAKELRINQIFLFLFFKQIYMSEYVQDITKGEL